MWMESAPWTSCDHRHLPEDAFDEPTALFRVWHVRIGSCLVQMWYWYPPLEVYVVVGWIGIGIETLGVLVEDRLGTVPLQWNPPN